jgi:transposase
MDLAKGGKIKQIARNRHLDPKTVRKIRDSGESHFEYVRTKVHRPALEPFVEKLKQLLSANTELNKRCRRPLIQIFEDLQREGFSGGYDSVRRFARRYQDELKNAPQKTSAQDAFVPLAFAPGESFQFDWSTNYILINGISTQVKVAHVTLAHSRMSFSRIYRRETLEMVLDAHQRAFTFFDGICSEGIYDNMTTAVSKVLLGKNREWNLRFSEYCTHHGFEHIACNPASGWEKGRVERRVQTDRVDFFKPTPRTDDESLEQLNQELLNRSIEKARRRKHPDESERTIWEVFQEEKDFLRPMKDGFEVCVEDSRSCSKTCLVQVDRNHYSAHFSASQQSVAVQVYADKIVIRHHGQKVAEHRRRFGRGKTTFDYRHYIGILERKPGAIRHGAPFKGDNLPKILHQVWATLKRQDRGDRSFANILGMIPEYGEDTVLMACRQVLDAGGVCESAITNRILRLSAPDPQWEDTCDDDHIHQLIEPPSSDCSEFDQLLQGKHEPA